MALLHRTVLGKDVPISGEYSIALGDAAYLLVEEQKDLIPNYMPGATISSLEARVREAERGDQGWDIVYDKRRGITPDRPVRVMGAANIERYCVLKGPSK